MNPTDLESLDRFEQQLAAAWPPSKWVNVKVLVAFSGGPDSTALTRALAVLQPDRSKLVLAHFNHRLRGAGADADQAFVQQAAQRWGLTVHVHVADAGSIEAARSGEGIESAARTQRYAFLVETAKRIGARFLATAHTMDDQIETVLQRILRGTGLAGLTGIPVFRGAGEAVTIVRPMLSIRRAEVLAYLGRLDQAFCVDSANQQRCFTRARIRHDLIPLLQREFNRDVGDAIQRLSRIAEEAQHTIRYFARQTLERCVVVDNASEVRIDTRQLHDLPLHLKREIFVVIWQRKDWPLQSMNFAQWQLLARLADPASSDGSLTLPGGVRARRTGSDLILSPAHPAAEANK